MVDCFRCRLASVQSRVEYHALLVLLTSCILHSFRQIALLCSLIRALQEAKIRYILRHLMRDRTLGHITVENSFCKEAIYQTDKEYLARKRKTLRYRLIGKIDVS
jgi:hypothetical protein